MKTTEFEQTIAIGVANFIELLETTLVMGAVDPDVSTEIFIPAVVLKDDIRNSVEMYSKKMLELHGVKD